MLEQEGYFIQKNCLHHEMDVVINVVVSVSFTTVFVTRNHIASSYSKIILNLIAQRLNGY